jgi:hypothetical protein
MDIEEILGEVKTFKYIWERIPKNKVVPVSDSKEPACWIAFPLGQLQVSVVVIRTRRGKIIEGIRILDPTRPIEADCLVSCFENRIGNLTDILQVIGPEVRAGGSFIEITTRELMRGMASVLADPRDFLAKTKGEVTGFSVVSTASAGLPSLGKKRP